MMREREQLHRALSVTDSLRPRGPTRSVRTSNLAPRALTGRSSFTFSPFHNHTHALFHSLFAASALLTSAPLLPAHTRVDALSPLSSFPLAAVSFPLYSRLPSPLRSPSPLLSFSRSSFCLASSRVCLDVTHPGARTTRSSPPPAAPVALPSLSLCLCSLPSVGPASLSFNKHTIISCLSFKRATSLNSRSNSIALEMALADHDHDHGMNPIRSSRAASGSTRDRPIASRHGVGTRRSRGHDHTGGEQI